MNRRLKIQQVVDVGGSFVGRWFIDARVRIRSK